MRPSVLLRAGAVVTASALALSLGSVPASAADSAPATASSQFQSADVVVRRNAAATTPADTAPLALTKFSLQSGVLFEKSNRNYVPGNVTVTGTTPYTAIYSRVAFNGVTTDDIGLTGVGTAARRTGGVLISYTRGAGRYSFPQSVFFNGTTQVEGTAIPSNTIRVRYFAKGPVKYRHKGKKLTVTTTLKRFDKSGSYVPLKSTKIKLQRKSGSTYKTIKTFKLNSKGAGKVTIKVKGKKRYRLYLPQSNLVASNSTTGTRI